MKTKKFVKYIWTVSDGTEIHTSPCPAGYKGVSYYGASEGKPFIAFLDKSLIEDFGLHHLVDHQRSTMIHLGWFRSVREAAAVAAMGYNDKEGMEYMLSFHQVTGNNNSGSGELFVDFPSNLEDLPETITASDAWTKYKTSKKKTSTKSAAKIVAKSHPQLDMKKYVKKTKGVDLSNATHRMLFDNKHGAAVVLEAILTLTGPEFVKKFWA